MSWAQLKDLAFEFLDSILEKSRAERYRELMADKAQNQPDSGRRSRACAPGGHGLAGESQEGHWAGWSLSI